MKIGYPLFFPLLMLIFMSGCQKADDDTIYLPSEPGVEEPEIEYVELQCENRALPCLILNEYYSNYREDSVFKRIYYHFDSLDRVINRYDYSNYQTYDYVRTEYLYYDDDDEVPYRINYYREGNYTSRRTLDFSADNNRLLSIKYPTSSSDRCPTASSYYYNSEDQIINAHLCRPFGDSSYFEIESEYFRTGQLVDSIYAITTFYGSQDHTQLDRAYFQYSNIPHTIDLRLLQIGMFPLKFSHSKFLPESQLRYLGDTSFTIFNEYVYEIDSIGRITKFTDSPVNGVTDVFY